MSRPVGPGGEELPPPVEKLTLAYREMSEINPKIVQHFGPSVRELDLSNNNLKYVLLF